MKFGRILALVASFLAIPAWAATLNVANNVELKVINGKPFKSKMFSDNKTVNLPDGDQQLVFRLNDSFRQGNSQELYSSEYYVIKIAAKGNEELTLKARPINNLSQAQNFDRNPEFTLTNAHGNPVPFKFSELKKEGMQINRDLVNELHDFNASGSPAAIESRAPFAALAMMNNQSTQLKASGGTQERIGNVLISEQMLHYWFQQADQATRERFMDWAGRSMKKTADK